MMDSFRSTQKAVIQFLLGEGEHASQIYRRMKEVYGEQCLTRCTIFRWCQRYEAGRGHKGLATPWAGACCDQQCYDFGRWMSSYCRIVGSPHLKLLLHCASRNPQKAWLWQSLCTLGQVSVRESEDGENGCFPDPSVSTLKPSTSFLRSGVSVSVSMSIIYSCTVPHEL
ncbi:hypothetical protein AVEN_165995-1 [Araneus ventricosus]|uniref:Mos1 transposase HTH domain-containing protein n=1 Tax=Araneus ventricosus TaxID=182803 RepID=A0A4Y2EXZ7_ARAVE|nr:hypothetical protein AVEN_88177-1 [Araneus ventricosus]GBM32877.1 hypothetical protein AVEN_165995-1 [Araneus ventricosus]